MFVFKASRLRTFLSIAVVEYGTNVSRGSTSEADLRQLIQSFKKLRILDLHVTSLKNVPRSIYKLKHLTYLDLSHNDALKRLPNSITRLQNLQTLNLYGCHALEELPRGIRKLVSLRNLDIDRCYKLRYVPHGLGQLSSLHRLTCFILPKDKALAKDCCGLGELKELNNIRGSLSIENLESVTDAVAKSRAANLMGKHSLESLQFRWSIFDTDDVVIGNRDEVLLDGLRPHPNLQKLTIERYKGESFPVWMMNNLVSSLPRLVELRFYGCGRCKSLPPLSQLPHLVTLEIWGITELEYIESDHSSTSTASFPNLLKLEIYYCRKLKAMPLTPHLEGLKLWGTHPALINMTVGLNKLKSLHIWDMELLECVPTKCWESLASLEFFDIFDCPRLTSLSTPPQLGGTRHQSNLVDLDSEEELDLSKYHESSGNNNNLILDSHGGLQNLRSVELLLLPKLASLPQWLLQLRNLEHLNILDCEELDLCKDESGKNNNLILDSHGGLQNLRFVKIGKLPKIASLPQWLLQLRNLERLKIRSCFNLKELLPEHIEALRSLQQLEIIDCTSLTSLPEGMRRLASLTHLFIGGCPELERRCKRDAGEDWYKISHIPHIQLR